MTKSTELATNVAKNITLSDLNKNGDAKRNNTYFVDARKINVNFDENPRKDYGSEEEQKEMVESIRERGVELPLVVSTRGNEMWLAHGFRRMKAIQTLLAEGVEINVNVKHNNNVEDVLIQHLTLNSGKPLNDNEISETLLQLSKYIGADNYKEIARRVGLDYQKVVKLMNYAKNASSQVKQAVTKGEVTLTNAIEFVVETPSIVAQNEILELAKQEPIVLKNDTKKVVLPTKKEAKKAADKAILDKAKNNAATVETVPTNTLAPIATATPTPEVSNKDNYSYLWQVLEEANASAFNTQLQKLLLTLEKGEATIEELVTLID